MSSKRQPAGVPSGGQFACMAHKETEVSLDDPSDNTGWSEVGVDYNSCLRGDDSLAEMTCYLEGPDGAGCEDSFLVVESQNDPEFPFSVMNETVSWEKRDENGEPVDEVLSTEHVGDLRGYRTSEEAVAECRKQVDGAGEFMLYVIADVARSEKLQSKKPVR